MNHIRETCWRCTRTIEPFDGSFDIAAFALRWWCRYCARAVLAGHPGSELPLQLELDFGRAPL